MGLHLVHSLSMVRDDDTQGSPYGVLQQRVEDLSDDVDQPGDIVTRVKERPSASFEFPSGNTLVMQAPDMMRWSSALQDQCPPAPPPEHGYIYQVPHGCAAAPF